MAAMLYVDPVSHAAKQALLDPAHAAQWRWLAARPLSVWLGTWTKDPTATVLAAMAATKGALRSFVVYGIPHLDSGAGGFATGAAYSEFIAKIAAGLAKYYVSAYARPIVVLEPDALAMGADLPPAQFIERCTLLRQAARDLQRAGAMVYLDAGDADWISAVEMGARLRLAGVIEARGFALNVAHTETTAESHRYAAELRKGHPDAHYIVDTGRNGLEPSDDNAWCNPLGRAVGLDPTVDTYEIGCDAYLWVKPPGESDGRCNGGPKAGTWWPEYAMGLVERRRL